MTQVFLAIERIEADAFFFNEFAAIREIPYIRSNFEPVGNDCDYWLIMAGEAENALQLNKDILLGINNPTVPNLKRMVNMLSQVGYRQSNIIHFDLALL